MTHLQRPGTRLLKTELSPRSGRAAPEKTSTGRECLQKQRGKRSISAIDALASVFRQCRVRS